MVSSMTMRKGEQKEILDYLKDQSILKIVIVGESGMGKSFLAREVVKDAISGGVCFESIWLSLNRRHYKRSIYEAIARQLSVLPDYEECGVHGQEEDDGDDDDEKLKNKIAHKLEGKFAEEKEKTEIPKKESGGREKKSVGKKFLDDGKKRFFKHKKSGEKKNSEENAEKKLLGCPEKKFLDEKETGERMFLKDNEVGEKRVLEGKKTGKEKEKPPDDDVQKKFSEKKGYGEGEKLIEEKGTTETLGKSFLLLVLDDEGNKTDEEHVMNEFGLRAFLQKCCFQWKVLITRRTRNESSVEKTKEIELTGLTKEASQALFNRFLEEEASRKLGLCVSSIAGKSNGVPAGIIVLAKSLSCVTQNGCTALSPELRMVFGANGFLVDVEKEDKVVSTEKLTTGNDLLLQLCYQTLTSDVLVNCLWQSLELFKNRGGAYYRDLINHWILEGCFDPVKSMKTTYLEAYDVLVELLNRGMLTKQVDKMMAPEERMKNAFDVHHPYGFFGKTSLRLAELIDETDQRDLEKTAQIDDMMKTITNKVSTVLVSGTRLRKETPGKFFKKMPNLEVLGLFEPAFDSLIQSISELQKLRILVIRDCDLLENIDPVAYMETLHALEISGVSILKLKPDDDLFRKMVHLQSLNLSGLPIESLPPSVSLLRELRYLILRCCPNLKALPNLQFLDNLEVIDTSGSTSLSNSEDKTCNINFFRLKKLQRLDFSQSKLIRMPLFQDSSLKWSQTQSSLTRLELRECAELSRVPNLKPLLNLEVLDLSGCVNVHGIRYQCFEEKKKLRLLDLSRTSISDLPSTLKELSSLLELNLRDCCHLTSLPDLEGLTSLQVLDASGCIELTEIAGSFKLMSYLEKLDLSATKVTSLPAFPQSNSLQTLRLRGCCYLKSFPRSEEDFPMQKVLQNLEALEISGCEELENLPELSDCSKLEIVDCSSCGNLEINEQSFGSMPCLQELDLSGTNIKKLSDMPRNCSKLSRLFLVNCTSLEDLKGIERFSQLKELKLQGIRCLNGEKAEFLQNLTELKVLNLSEIHLSELSCISRLTNLQNLSLAINPDVAASEFLSPLKSFKSLEVLSFSGTTITSEVLNKVHELFSAKRLILPEINIIEELDWRKIQGYVKEISFEDHCFSVPVEIAVANAKPIVQVDGTKLLQLEEDKLDDFRKLFFKGFNIFVCLKEQCYSNNRECCLIELHGYGEVNQAFRYLNQEQACIEIHGCDGSGVVSNLINEWLSLAENISLVENLSTSCSSIFSAAELKFVKGCRVERCMKMGNLFDGELQKPVASQIQQLETLHISNLPKLTNICSNSEKFQDNVFQNLKKLILECCPEVEIIFQDSLQVPKALEFLQIKFCDKLKKVFEGCDLSKLHTLILESLPVLSSIGAVLPRSFKVYHMENCPKLQ